MKNFLVIICLPALLYSCASTKEGASNSAARNTPKTSSGKPRFLENIVIRPSAKINTLHPELLSNTPPERNPAPGFGQNIEDCTDLQFKYAILMEEPVELVTDLKLISFLEHWYGVPYKYGGGTKKGIDCSAFSGMLMDSVYRIILPRTSKEQYSAGTRISRSQLLKGDLVFFNTNGGISHVGVFLSNNKFVHASVSGGVMISDLDDGYFKKRYVGSVRVK